MILFIVMVWSFSCSTDYVTGKRTFSLISESHEIAMGKEADPQIIAQYGLYKDRDIAAYVDRIGQSLAAVSQRPNLRYTFRVLDSPVVNAFALPGGYVYVTRGILAHANSEDELAGIIGHEIGHVVARHSAEQMSKAGLAGLGLGLGSVIWKDFEKIAGAAETGIGLLFLSFSRKQESESDMLGVDYSTDLGYNAHRMAGFFGTLKKMNSIEGQKSLPAFLSTHPDPGDRENRVHRLASERQAKGAFKPLKLKKYAYLKMIDGMIYGEDPRQGFSENGIFYHPDLGFKFPVPQGWKLVNTPVSVRLVSSDNNAVLEMTLGKSGSLNGEAQTFITKSKAAVQKRDRVRINGFDALKLRSIVSSDERVIAVMSLFVTKDGRNYIFHAFAGKDVFADYMRFFDRVLNGFDRIRDEGILATKPRRIILKRIPREGSFEKALLDIGVRQKEKRECALINEKPLEQVVDKGEWIKVISK